MHFPAEQSLHYVHFHCHYRQCALCYLCDKALTCEFSRGSERLLAGKSGNMRSLIPGQWCPGQITPELNKDEQEECSHLQFTLLIMCWGKKHLTCILRRQYGTLPGGLHDLRLYLKQEKCWHRKY